MAITATSGYASTYEQLAAYFQWNTSAAHPFFLTGATNVISNDNYLSKIVGENTMSAVLGKDHRYKVNIQGAYNFVLQAVGKISSIAYDKW